MADKKPTTKSSSTKDTPAKINTDATKVGEANRGLDNARGKRGLDGPRR